MPVPALQVAPPSIPAPSGTVFRVGLKSDLTEVTLGTAGTMWIVASGDHAELVQGPLSVRVAAPGILAGAGAAAAGATAGGSGPDASASFQIQAGAFSQEDPARKLADRLGAETLWSTASTFGHFTAMQVRRGRTRGLELHLHRLDAATQELFGSDLEGEPIRALVRHALRDVADASVRVYVFESEGGPAVMVTVKEPGEISAPQRLQSVAYQRPTAHLKHLATEQGYYSRFARLGGFDDALLTTTDGRISESATANVAFLDDEGVVWPEGDFLHGITMQLLEVALPDAGVASRRAPLHLADIPQFRGAIVSNARGVAPVSAIDGRSLETDASRVRAVADVYATLPWDPI